MSGATPQRASAVFPAESVHTELFSDREFNSVIYDSRSQRVIRLNPSATAVWSLVDGVATETQIVSEIQEIFDLSHESAALSVKAAIEQFRTADLLAASVPEILSAPQAPELRRLEREPDP